jgi:hypothetical protein
MKRKMMLSFSVFTTFLLVSVSFITLVSAKTVFETNDSGDKQIGDLIKELAEYGPIHGAISIILANVDDNDMKVGYLHCISNIVETGSMKSTFDDLVNKIYFTYTDEFDSLENGASDGMDIPEDVKNDIIESDAVAIQNVFEFTFIKPKPKIQTFLTNPFIDKIIQKIPILRNLFNKADERKDINSHHVQATGNTISLYHKGSKDPIISGQLYKINAFLLILEATIRDCNSEDFDLDGYCNDMNAASDFRLDENIQDKIQTINEDLNLETRIKSIEKLPVEQRSVAFDEIIDDIQSHGLYPDIESVIIEKFGDDGPQTNSIIVLVIVIALIAAIVQLLVPLFTLVIPIIIACLAYCIIYPIIIILYLLGIL